MLQCKIRNEEKDRDLENCTFRPNIVIDTQVPYEEDGFKEVRIENIFMRLVGNCARCKAVTNNYNSSDRNP